MKKQYNLKSVVLPLILINVVVYILQILFGDTFTSFFMLSPRDILSRPFTLITGMFLHSTNGINHIFWNMYGLMMFGTLLEQKIGPKRFLFIYLFSGLMASIGHIVISNILFGSASPALGASGAIMGMLGAMVVLLPEVRLLFFFFIPMSLRTAGVIWILMDVFGVFIPNGIGNVAHLAGMFTGLIYGLILNKQKKHYYKKFTKPQSIQAKHLDTNDFDEYIKSGRL